MPESICCQAHSLMLAAHIAIEDNYPEICPSSVQSSHSSVDKIMIRGCQQAPLASVQSWPPSLDFSFWPQTPTLVMEKKFTVTEDLRETVATETHHRLRPSWGQWPDPRGPRQGMCCNGGWIFFTLAVSVKMWEWLRSFDVKAPTVGYISNSVAATHANME